MSALDGVTRSWPTADADGLPVACLICGADKGPCKWICLDCSPSRSEAHTRVIEAWKARPGSTAAAQAALSLDVDLLVRALALIEPLAAYGPRGLIATKWLADYRRLRGGK